MEKHSQGAAYLQRENVLALLSDTEVARVSTAETVELSPSEQYLDLQHLELGVQVVGPRGHGSTGNVLPKRSVDDATWRKILSALTAPRDAVAPPDAYAATLTSSRTP